MKSQVTKEMLFNYFAGNASVFQKQMIDNWAKHPENQELFYVYLAQWEKEFPQYTPDTHSALLRHRERMLQQQHDETEKVQVERPKNVFQHFTPTFMWAASVVFLMFIGAWVFRENITHKTYRTVYGQTQSLELEDGSQVILNANSSLKVPRFGFTTDVRQVILKGEANFVVTHQTNNQRFVVKTDQNLEVEVLGTEFVVSARSRGSKVVLNKGKVQLRYQEGKTQKQLTMKPGDLVTMDAKEGTKLRQIAKPENHAAWKNHRFVFEETSLAEVAMLFEDNFGVKVEIPEAALAQWTLSGSFTANNAEELLETLSEASNLYFRKERNKIIITTNQ
ncbi:MAG: FecR domain-containing protein [Spirosomataceae bacterium]